MSLDTLRLRYFAAPEHQRDLQPGEILLEQGAHNRRLYLLLAGQVRGRYLAAAEGEWLDILQVEAGRFMGGAQLFLPQLRQLLPIGSHDGLSGGLAGCRGA